MLAQQGAILNGFKYPVLAQLPLGVVTPLLTFFGLSFFYYSGFNLRSTDLNAFIGIQQMKVLNKKIKTRFRNFKIFSKNLSNFWSQKSEAKIISNFGYALMVKNRSEVFNFLKKNKIETRPLICGNMGQQPFWIKKYKRPTLPNAEKVHKFGLYLPNHENLTAKQVEFICDKVKIIAKPFNFI